MMEEKMGKTLLCEDELDQVAGGWLRPKIKKRKCSASNSEETEKLMGDFAQSSLDSEQSKFECERYR